MRLTTSQFVCLPRLARPLTRLGLRNVTRPTIRTDLNRLDTDIDWGETESVQAPRTDPFGGASRSPDTGPGSETK